MGRARNAAPANAWAFRYPDVVNWARDYLLANPDLASRMASRHRYGFRFRKPPVGFESHFVGKPAHYESSPGVWAPIDTALVDDGTFLSGQGTPVRIRKANGAVEAGTKIQRASRIVRYRPSSGTLSQMAIVPTTGLVADDTWSRTWGTLTYTVRLHESGVQQTLVLGTLPTLPGATRPDDYVMIDEQVPGFPLADGWLDAPYSDGGFYHPLPVATDSLFAAGRPRELPVRRLVRSDAQGKWILTGLLVSDFQRAVYPLTIDPDYSATTADGYVSGVNATYATARSTSTTHATGATSFTVGQEESSVPKTTSYVVSRGFLKFDTAAIPDTDAISQVNLKLVCIVDNSGTNFDVQIVKQDWSGQDPLAAGNREAAYDNCLSGTADDNIWRNTLGMSINTQYASGNLATSWVVKTGPTYYSLRSSRDLSGTAPGEDTNEYIDLASQEHATSAYRPVLTVVHAGGTAARPSGLKILKRLRRR